MYITSITFQNGQPIPSQYTCDGENSRPPLQIGDVPPKTKSLALIMDDPDAPSGTWLHWTLWNIAPDVVEISERSLPAQSVEGMTSFGAIGYGGPCPHSGTHHYVFSLYALDTTLELERGATREMLEEAMKGHVIETATLVGMYQRTEKRG